MITEGSYLLTIYTLLVLNGNTLTEFVSHLSIVCYRYICLFVCLD